MAFKEVRTSITQNVALYRTCEFCGHEYKFIRQVSATGKSGWGKDSRSLGREARENAWENVAEKEPVVFDDQDGVVCPKCARFSTGATRKHFPEGLRAGLHRKLKISGTSHLVTAVTTLAVLGMLVVWQYQDWDRLHARIQADRDYAPIVNYGFLGLIWFVEFIVLCLALVGVTHSFRAWRSLGRLSAIGDKRLHMIAVEACLDTGNSLKPLGFVYNLVPHLEAFFRPADEATNNEPRESSSRQKKSTSRKPADAPKTTVSCRDCGANVSVPVAKAAKRVRCETCKDRRMSRDALQRKYGFTKGNEVYERLQSQRHRRKP